MRVADVMQHDVVTAQPEVSLKQAAELLIERGISGLPVVGADGRVTRDRSSASTAFEM